MSAIKYIKQNKEWIFSGIGSTVAVVLYEIFKENGFQNIIGPIALGTVLIFISIIAFQVIGFLKRKDFYFYVKSIAREFLDIIQGDRKTYVKSKYKYNSFDIHQEYHDLSELLKEFVCYNQGKFASYSFELGELHKIIKNELNSEKPDLSKLKENCIKLLNYSIDQFKSEVKYNYNEYIMRYFKNRAEYMPRMTVKACNNKQSIDLFRLHKRYFTNYESNENRGFQRIFSTGKYFLCNNIPLETAKGDYYNPRLKSIKVVSYINYMKEHSLNEHKAKHDNTAKKLWMDCWVNEGIEDDKREVRIDPTHEECYKSTLIIPITLINSEISNNLRAHFDIPKVELSQDEIARSIYAFLCFDHQDISYFIKDIDVKIGYLFADILSLYLLDCLRYTKYSKNTFRKAIEKFPELQEKFPF